jgi:3D (Asp-Asp-Asp) domain-containing protein
VRTQSRSGAARLAAAFTAVLLVASVPVAVGADSTALRAQADGLRARSGSLEARASSATLELYALETELSRARAELAAIEARRQQLAREQASARAQLAAARKAMRHSHAQLSDLARALYERPNHDPIAILLAADSLEQALAGLDGIDRAAGQANRILERARAAKQRLAAADARLSARAAELTRAASAAEAEAASLESTLASRRQFVAGLRREQGLNAARIASIESQARAAERRAATVVAAASAAAPTPETSEPGVEAPAARAPVVLAGPGTLTVSSTGYAIKGHTATGIPTAPGVVAVDPSVIPLGTRLTIPGYGTGIAADTGGAIRGAKIDLWFPTRAQALAWGHRTVTITIH